jgi:DNA helicase II / ATP-dependent DNA helicase PcrA
MKLFSPTTIILGPPGTGKTTALMGVLDELLEAGVPPERICFLSFTRKAIKEARDRAIEKFGFSAEQAVYFRTIHSLCFQQLGLTRKDIMGFADYCNIAKEIGISITNRAVSEDGIIAPMSKGDRLLFTENLARVNGVTVEEQWERLPDEEFFLEELVQVHKTLIKYKNLNYKQDFTDMIEMFLLTEPVPHIDYLIVDEAQDLASNQWAIIQALSKRVKETFIAGDDDQAIFRWAGANVDNFIELEGETWTLDQSYRIPAAVRNIADGIINHVSKRRAKEWHSRDEQGSVEYINSVDELDMSKGQWLILARNSYLLGEFNDYCLDRGYVYESTTGSLARGEALKAVRLWEMLRKGTKITVEQALHIYGYMSARERIKHGFKQRLEKEPHDTMVNLYDLRRDYGLLTDGIWHYALDKLSDIERLYFISALKQGEKLTKEPRIKISTIHSIKGGEADNVVLCTDMAKRTWDEYQVNEDDEARVWYVACTRAKKNLFIMTPRNDRHFPI